MDKQAIKDEICDRLAGGESLIAICEDVHMPSTSTIFTWRRKDDEFCKEYDIARECQRDRWEDELREMVKATPEDDCKYGNTAVSRSKLEATTLMWMMSKRMSSVYGDKMNVEHSGGVTQKRIVIVRSFDEVEITDKRRGLGLGTPN